MSRIWPKVFSIQPGTDIRDHLNELFFMAAPARPKLMVELGTRGGESTRALLAAAALSNATLVSVDIDDCAGLDLPYREHWRFIKADDIKFGMDGFKQWCAEEGVEPSIEVLFIDTSHAYEHTKNEIRVWSPYLGEDGVMMFHDSNMGNGVYARTDGSFGHNPNPGRGVIQPIEEFLGRRYDENAYFADYQWLSRAPLSALQWPDRAQEAFIGRCPKADHRFPQRSYGLNIVV